MLFSPGAPDTPSGGSSCNRLKSLINRRRAVVAILIETELDQDRQWNYGDWYREMSTCLCKRRSRNFCADDFCGIIVIVIAGLSHKSISI